MTKLYALLFVLAMAVCAPAVADEPPGFGDPGSPDPIPVDGGASLLLAAGAGYGYRKLKARRKAKAA